MNRNLLKLLLVLLLVLLAVVLLDERSDGGGDEAAVRTVLPSRAPEPITDPSEVEIEVNRQRTGNGHKPLLTSVRLRESACAKAEDMLRRRYWGHFAPDGSGNPFELMKAAGFSLNGAGENLYYTTALYFEPVRWWMHSPGHRDNMMNPEHQYQGICMKEGPLNGRPHVYLFVQHLGSV